MRQILQLICLGWKIMSHASTASWALSLLPSGITSALSAALVWFLEQRGPIVVVTFILVFASVFICTLAFLGSREQQIQSFYNSWLHPAAENINQVMQLVIIALRRHPDAAVRNQESLVQRSIVDEERAALSRLSNALRGVDRTSGADLQDRIGGYYRNYQNNRTWVAKGMSMTGLSLAHDSIFREWRRLDAEFIHELRRLSGHPRYNRLRQLIQEVGWGETVTRNIEDAP